MEMEVHELKELVRLDDEKFDRLEGEIDKITKSIKEEIPRLDTEIIEIKKYAEKLAEEEPEELDLSEVESRLDEVESNMDDKMDNDDGVDEDRATEIAQEVVEDEVSSKIETELEDFQRDMEGTVDSFVEATASKVDIQKLMNKLDKLTEKVDNVIKLNKLKQKPPKK